MGDGHDRKPKPSARARAKPRPGSDVAGGAADGASEKHGKRSAPAPDVQRLAEPRPTRQRPAARAKKGRPNGPSRTTPPAPRRVRAERAEEPVAVAAAPSPDAAGAQGAPGERGAVLVTGICGRLGRLLARKLHRTTRVIGIDRRAYALWPKDVVHHQFDLRRKKTRDLFRHGAVKAVVHLGVLHDPRKSDKEHHSWNIIAFQKLLEYLSEYGVPKLVVLSSANVYGPQPDNPQFLTEEAPLLGAQSFRQIRDLVEMDMLAQSFFWRHPDAETVILRPCHILGGVSNAASNYLRLERPMTVLGFDPMVQAIHERDVVDAIVRALEPGARGIFNLRGPGELPLSRVLRFLRRRPIPLPSFMAKGTVERMWRYRLTSFPAPELDHIRFLCMVDDTRAREVLGFRPRHGLRETLLAVDEER